MNEHRSHRTPGSRTLARAAAALLAWALPLQLAAQPVTLPVDELTPIRCGASVRRQVPAGGVARFAFEAVPGQRIAIDAVDVSTDDELLRIRMRGADVATNTCTGRIQPPMRAAAQLIPGERYVVEISDCKNGGPVDFSLSLNTVSAIAENCGTRLLCGQFRVATFSLPAEVDSYRFEGTVGETVTLETRENNPSLEGVELRIFDPDGELVENDGSRGCASSRTIALPKTGVYTVLANPCYGTGVGPYEIGWFPRICPAITQLGKTNDDTPVAIRTAYDGTSLVEISVGALSCGFAETDGFVLQPNQALTIDGGHFVGSNIRLSARDLTLDIDGEVTDTDGDGQVDQSMGGLSIARRGGRCSYRWQTTSLPDADADGWSDLAETQLGSQPARAESVPESRLLRVTRLLGLHPCRDFQDNDRDGLTDESDPDCQPTPAVESVSPRVFSGWHSGGQALWLKLSNDGRALQKVSTAGFLCGAREVGNHTIDLETSITNGRFSVLNLALGSEGDAEVSFDGVLFDANGDSAPDQALGGFVVRLGTSECRFFWCATAHIDSDSDGWSDAAELRLGSDPWPWPLGTGPASRPEDRAIPVTALAATDLCADGRDNDGDNLTDAQDTPACAGLPAPTATPTFAVPATATATGPIVPPTSTRPARTPTPPAISCTGDCDGNGEVTIDEVIAGISIILGSAATPSCPAFDGNDDLAVTVDELVQAVHFSLAGCP